MTVLLIDVEHGHCRTVLGPTNGPRTVMCGERALPGTNTCRDCRARFYYRPTVRELKGLDYAAGRPLKARGT